MRRRNDLGLERALRACRPEPRPEFLRSLADAIRRDIGGHRRPRARWLSLGLAVVLTAILIGALGAVGAHRSAGPAAIGAVQVVKAAVSSPKNNVQVVTNTPADDEYHKKCNSGRGNLSEIKGNGTHDATNSTTPLVNPHEGGTGPGNLSATPSNECDPGNSETHNRGGD